ncbi:hypothetical protein NliqN6_3231 [Naganishia liquefaciens]|uniref:Sel1 repeat family protein n=1 Tax=Naganishia liquefaciens TaxID=104408 RepID=A0A8H3YET6_9TREE|nr:hypothetical protein NliqN6_3231 [Naganishia liquefaciens]
MQTYTPVPGMGANPQQLPQTAQSPISPSSYAQNPMYRQGSPSHPPLPPQAQPIQQQQPPPPPPLQMGMSMQPQQTGATATSGVGRGNQAPAPFAQPMPLLDNSHLRPGASAALLSHDKKLELYRASAKKTNDPELSFEFAVFLIEAAKSLETAAASGAAKGDTANEQKRDDLIREAIALLKTLSSRGHPDAQYFLADCYANGIGTVRGKQDFEKAFPLFVLAAKHGHPDAAYRAGTCCEHGWGCRRESAKAVQFYRKAAASLHAGAMYRLGTAELNGALGLAMRPKEGVKWLKRSAENATPEFPHALHELALLHERGIDNVLFVDLEYASELLAQAAELGYAPSAFKLGECYEYGRMGCPQDAALSIHYYNIAAQQDHRDGCFALTAWYLVGSPGVLPQSDTEAFLWAKKAAELGLAKAQYAVGYFTEVGIGTPSSPENAIKWYKLAAENGDKRATNRLANFSKAGTKVGGAGATREELLARAAAADGDSTDSGGKRDKDCVIM